MYIINYVVNGVRRLATGECCVRAQANEATPSTDTEGETTRSILQNDAETPSYASIGTNETSQPCKGYTDKWVDYFHSDGALRQALLHLVFYYAAAIVAFSFAFEKWTLCDTLYFATVIFTTVGYGDLSPQSDAGRIFTIFLALYGIVILGVFLGIGGALILERHGTAIEKRMANAQSKVVESLKQGGMEAAETRPSPAKQICDIIILEAPIVCILIILAIPICWNEGWTLVQSLYWCTITGTTIGFGDLSPVHESTRFACVLYIPLAVAVLGEFLGRIAGVFLDNQADALEDRFLARSMTLLDLERMDIDDDGKVSEAEFLCHMLVALQKIQKEDIDEMKMLFKKLDKSCDGYITKQDLEIVGEKCTG